MQNLMKKKAELALLYAVPILSTAQANSRLSGLQRSLQDTVIPAMQRIVGFTDSELDRMIGKILVWGQETGWLDDTKHISTLVSFCMDMIEKSEFEYEPKVWKILGLLTDHLENGNKLKPLSCYGGSVAAEKWDKLFKEETHGNNM